LARASGPTTGLDLFLNRPLLVFNRFDFSSCQPRLHPANTDNHDVAAHDDVPETADFVMYWWNRAATLVRERLAALPAVRAALDAR
jgi:hypothetical protein